jgi:hypothetical protein
VVKGLLLVLLGSAVVSTPDSGLAEHNVTKTVKGKKIVPIVYAPIDPRRAPSMPPDLALAAVSGRLSQSSVVSAGFGDAPSGVSQERAKLPWLNETVKAVSVENGLAVKALWEADLLEGAVVELYGASGNARNSLGGATFDLELPNGALLRGYDGGLGDVAVGQQFNEDPDSEVAASVRAVLARFELQPVSIDILRALRPAPAIVASTAHPEAAARGFAQFIKALFGTPPSYEGYFVSIEDRSGNPVLTASASFRTGAGRCWIARKYIAEASLPCGMSKRG